MSRSPSAALGRAEALPFKRKFGYGVCCYGTDIFFQAASFFLLFYYTDVLGLSPTAAGAIYMMALIWDGITDPVVGQLANRNHSRWGRYRPFILFGALPLAASYVLMFAQPFFVASDVAAQPAGFGSAIFVYALLTHVLFRTAYTFVSIPFGALSAQITRDSGQRSALAASRVVFATLAGLTVAVSTQPLVARFGNGDPQLGYFWVAVLFAAIAVVAFVTSFALTREHRLDQRESEPSLRQALAMLASNRPFWLIVSAIVLASLGGTMFSKALPYICKYNFGDESLVRGYLANLVLLVGLFTPIWAWVSAKIGKRAVWLCGAALSTAAMLLLILRPLEPDGLMLATRIYGIGFAALAVMFWSIVPDTVEYGQWRSGVRAEGMLFGFVSLAQKVALGLGVGALGVGLDWVGFDANLAQTPDTLRGIALLMAAGPLIGIALSALVMLGYRIDADSHAKMRQELAARSGAA